MNDDYLTWGMSGGHSGDSGMVGVGSVHCDMVLWAGELVVLSLMWQGVGECVASLLGAISWVVGLGMVMSFLMWQWVSKALAALQVAVFLPGTCWVHLPWLEVLPLSHMMWHWASEALASSLMALGSSGMCALCVMWQ